MVRELTADGAEAAWYNGWDGSGQDDCIKEIEMDELEVTFLEMGRQTAEDVARRLAEFLGLAQRTIDFAIYNFHLDGAAGEIVTEALRERAAAGVAIRLVYEGDEATKPETPDPDKPTPETQAFIQGLGYEALADPGSVLFDAS